MKVEEYLYEMFEKIKLRTGMYLVKCSIPHFILIFIIQIGIIK